MAGKRRAAAYIPITSIVIALLVVAALVIVTSVREIQRARAHANELLERRAGSMLTFLVHDIRTEIVSPRWQPDRLQFLAQNVPDREGLQYISILGSDGTTIIHTDPELIGQPYDGWSDAYAEIPDHAITRVTPVGGWAQAEFLMAHDVVPRSLCRPMPPPFFRRLRGGAAPWCDAALAAERLGELLGQKIAPDESVRIYVAVGIRSADMENVLGQLRRRSMITAGLMLAVSGVAIYFLFVLASYRSTRTALANMRSYTNNIIESMASGLVTVDADGHVVHVNSRAREMLKLGDGSVAGARLDNILSLADGPERGDVDSVLEGMRDLAEVEMALETGSGSIPVTVGASLLRDEGGDRVGAVLLIQDLSEIEALKQEVERGRHLAALGRLAAGVAHEVRNPLSSLKGFAQFLRSKFHPGSQEERYSDIMIEEVERLDRVVQELLDFARPVTAERSPSDLNRIAEESLALIVDDASYRDVTVERSFADSLPPVLVDPRQVRQALLNVLLNGLEAMPEGGTLTVATALKPGGAAVSVRDTGTGMSRDEQEKLFEPFYTTKPSGTGLGMTIVSRLVEQNGGHISIESEPGRGTTFTIVFPRGGASDGGEE